MVIQVQSGKGKYEALQFSRVAWSEIQEFTDGKAQALKIFRCPHKLATCAIEGDTIKEGDWILKQSGELITCSRNMFYSIYTKIK